MMDIGYHGIWGLLSEASERLPSLRAVPQHRQEIQAVRCAMRCLSRGACVRRS